MTFEGAGAFPRLVDATRAPRHGSEPGTVLYLVEAVTV